MIKERIVLDNDINKCKELYDGLSDIMKAYESLPILKDIHSKTGNRILNTSVNPELWIAKAFNDLIIEYASKPSDQLEDDDEW